MIRTCAQTNDALEHLGRRAVAERVRDAVRDRRPARRVTRSARARCATRASRRASTTMPAISARIRSASPQVAAVEAPRPLRPCGSRTPSRRRRARARRRGRPGTRTSPGARARAASSRGRRSPIIAMTIVGKSTMKPQKIERVHQARDEPLEQLALPEHDRPPRCARAAGTSSKRVDRLAHAHEPVEQAGPAARRAPAQTSSDDEQDEAGDHYAPRWPPDLGGDRGHDLVQVADHRVVGDSP